MVVYRLRLGWEVGSKGQNSRTWGKERNFEQVKYISTMFRFVNGYK